MLIRHVPDAYEKLHILGGMAGDDILSPSSDSNGPRVSRMPYRSPAKNSIPSVYKAAMPNGKYISLMRVMFTDLCMLDCAYCPTATGYPRSVTPSRWTSWLERSTSSKARTR
jgi:predicted DNA-binding helix-hairpin-helix protein